MAEPIFLNSLMLGDTTDVSGFEKEISSQLINTSHMLVADARDVEDLIADALKRRCCHSSNNRRAALHMHLRLKKGDSQTTMTRHEMADLAEMVATKGAPNAIVNRLANFYVRIAILRAQIEGTRRSLDACCTDIPVINMNNANTTHLRAAHAKNEENLCEKRNENQRELARIMSALFLESAINPALTEDDLPALEMQTQHITERGCATQELRRLKIVEAALEQQRLDELMAELNM
jgi:hypothetical protein